MTFCWRGVVSAVTMSYCSSLIVSMLPSRLSKTNDEDACPSIVALLIVVFLSVVFLIMLDGWCDFACPGAMYFLSETVL